MPFRTWKKAISDIDKPLYLEFRRKTFLIAITPYLKNKKNTVPDIINYLLLENRKELISLVFRSRRN